MSQWINGSVNTIGVVRSDSEPANPYPCMIWVDSVSGQVQVRNVANDTWILVGYSDQPLYKVDSPEFAGLKLTGFNGILKATAGVISAGVIAYGDTDFADQSLESTDDVVFGSVQASHKAVDGTVGATADITLPSDLLGGTITLHFKDGLFVGST